MADPNPDLAAVRRAWAWTTLILVVGAGAWASRYVFAPASSPSAPEIVVAHAGPPPAPANKPVDWDAWRRKAWTKIEPRLAAAERAAQVALDEELRTIDEFFRERGADTRGFAEAVLSFGGKWEFVKSKLPTADDHQHLRYLNEQFEARVFRVDELRQVVESAVGAYVSRVQGIENQLLVDVRADLSSGELGVATPPRFVSAENEFRRGYATLLDVVSADVARDFNVAVSREVTSLVAGEAAAVIAVRIASAVGARLGVSAGVLGAGAASGWGTFGAGLVAAVVVDVALDRVLRAAGYDPVARVREKIDEVLRQVRGLIVDGDPEAAAVYEKLVRMARDDPDAEVRRECAVAVRAIEAGGGLGLRRELQRLQAARNVLRREALRRLVFTGET